MATASKRNRLRRRSYRRAIPFLASPAQGAILALSPLSRGIPCDCAMFRRPTSPWPHHPGMVPTLADLICRYGNRRRQSRYGTMRWSGHLDGLNPLSSAATVSAAAVTSGAATGPGGVS
jgi:hypothetical protein